MLAYATLGTNDLEKSKAFYDKVFTIMGINPMMQTDRYVAYGRSMTEPMLLVMKPWDEQPATPGNGSMISLLCSNPEQVDAVHKQALDLGAPNEGDSGPRGEQFYCGYFRDPDGNKINAFCFQTQG